MTVQELLESRRSEALAFLTAVKVAEAKRPVEKVFFAYQGLAEDGGYREAKAALIAEEDLRTAGNKMFTQHDWCMDTWTKIASYGVAETELFEKEADAFLADIVRRALLLGSTEESRDMNVRRMEEDLKKPDREGHVFHTEEEVREHLAKLLGFEVYRKDAEEIELYDKIRRTKYMHDRHSMMFEAKEARRAVFGEGT